MRYCLTLGSVLLLSSCGGGSGTAPPLATGNNVTTLIVDTGPAGTINSAFATATVCVPGTSNCVTIDHLQVDTGSTGLRIVAGLLPATVSLPQATGSDGLPLYECMQFADSYTWGAVRTADVQVGGEQARILPLQIVGETSVPPTPADCPNGSPAANSVQTLGANGVLGIGVFREDCGTACTTSVVPAAYYTCAAAGCGGVMAALSLQVQNPVYRFASDNNGVILQLPAVGAAGALGARGSLIFGINTQSNNQLGTATVLTVNPIFGNLSTSYKGQTFANSFIDSGSNGYFFADATLSACTGTVAPGFYCPSTVQSLNAINQSYTGVSSTVNFSVANAEALVGNQPTYAAFQSLAGPNPLASSFDWGLPFFFGRSVFYAIEGQSTGAGAGPYIAY
jgi:hypothetical protein